MHYLQIPPGLAVGSHALFSGDHPPLTSAFLFFFFKLDPTHSEDPAMKLYLKLEF